VIDVKASFKLLAFSLAISNDTIAMGLRMTISSVMSHLPGMNAQIITNTDNRIKKKTKIILRIFMLPAAVYRMIGC
jgi:hypothetical protein